MNWLRSIGGRWLTSHPNWLHLCIAVVAFFLAFSIPLPEMKVPTAPPRGQPDGPRVGTTVVIACDDGASVYMDGRPVGSVDGWTNPLLLPLPLGAGNTLIAVEATNREGAAGLLGAIVDDRDFRIGLGTARPADWVCSSTPQPGWFEPQFDDQTWARPGIQIRYGSPPWGMFSGPDLIGASWIWKSEPASEPETIYCRWRAPSPGLSPGSEAQELVALRQVTGGASASAARSLDSSHAPRGPTVILACDNMARTYLDGQAAGEITSWREPLSLPMPRDKSRTLVAVRAANDGGAAGLLGMLVDAGRSRQPADWRCSTKEQPGWNQPDFDDRAWGVPRMLSPYGAEPWFAFAGPLLYQSSWVWTTDRPEPHDVIYCRWWVSLPAAATPSPIMAETGPEGREMPSPVPSRRGPRH
jgi:hypothetical protein